MNLQELTDLLPPDFEIVLADVGAVGGLKDRWAAVRNRVTAIMFDPRTEQSAPREGTQRDRNVTYPVALSREDSELTLYVTKFGNMSSVLKPNPKILGRYRKWGEAGKVIKEIPFSATTLDAIATRGSHIIDTIKVDTQGHEIDVLRGSTFALSSSVIFVEVEVSFIERYVNQPLFGDVARFMDSHEFELLDLYQQRRYYAKNSFGFEAGKRGEHNGGQLAYSDAIFMLREKKLLDRILAFSDEKRSQCAAKAIILLLTYGKIDIACSLYDFMRPHLIDSYQGPFDQYFGATSEKLLEK